MQDNQELLKKINLIEGDPDKVFTSRPWMDQRKGKKKRRPSYSKSLTTVRMNLFRPAENIQGKRK